MGGDEPPVPLTPSHFPSGSNECFQVHEGGCSVWGLYDPVPFPVPESSATVGPCPWNRQRVELWVTHISCLGVPVSFWEQMSIRNTVSLEEHLKKLSSRGAREMQLMPRIQNPGCFLWLRSHKTVKSQ